MSAREAAQGTMAIMAWREGDTTSTIDLRNTHLIL